MARQAALLMLFLLAACGARTAPGREAAAPQYWRAPGAETALRIEGYLETRRGLGALGSRPEHEVVISVDGQEALRAPMPRDRPIEATGRAQGSEVSAMCAPRMVARATMQVTCLVLVDQERAASLSFTAGTARAPVAAEAAAR